MSLKSCSPFKATKLWNQLLSSFKEGMELKRKRYRLKSYDQCFSGAEALDWLHMYLQNSPSFGDHVTREQAFMLLQKFIENNVFQNAVGKTCKKFQDTNCLYKFIEEKENIEPRNIRYHNKENETSQISLNNIIKHFARRNSRNIKEYEQTHSGKVVENNIFSARIDDEHKKCKAVSSGPLALDSNRISMATTVKAKQYQYADMSTRHAEENQTELFDTSISRRQSRRGNSLHVNERRDSNMNFISSSSSGETKNDKYCMADKENQSENGVSSKGYIKRAFIRNFRKNSHKNSESCGHTVISCKRLSNETENCQSPKKRLKKESDSKLENKGYTTNLLPRKAVVVLGERPSHINHVESYNTYNVVNLPGYKPSKTSKSHMSKKGQDYKLPQFNSMKNNKNENMEPKRKEKKGYPMMNLQLFQYGLPIPTKYHQNSHN